MSLTTPAARAIAFYLPQFYPIPENDEWWGKGFTEWTNVAKAKPRFKGHYQPHLPADLGFYDLRLSDTLYEQADLMNAYNISGMCFYHYWFSGKKLLERPSENLLLHKDIQMPFMFCWANQDWTRNWDGFSNTILLEQKYSFDDDRSHILHLIRFFEDDRYLKIDGKPLFAVYRTELFPDIRRTADIWRHETEKAGFPGIYLLNIENIVWSVDPSEINFDAGIDFHPKAKNLPSFYRFDFFVRLLKKSINVFPMELPIIENDIWRYEDYVDNNILSRYPSYKMYPSLFPMWDNSSRREKGAWIFHDSTDVKFKRWLAETLNYFDPYSAEENFVFINAWNEWAEGNHLEPCQKWGTSYLEVVKNLF